MSPAVSLALLSVNVFAFYCSHSFAKHAGEINLAIRTGKSHGVRTSKKERLMMISSMWFAPVITQVGLASSLILLNLEVAAETESEGARILAYVSVFFWGIAVLGTFGFGINDAVQMRASVRSEAGPPPTSP